MIILFGLPLMGKTSFLNQMEPLLASRHTVVRTDAPLAGSNADPLQFLLARLAQAAEFAPADAEALGRRNREYLADYVHAVAARLEQAARHLCGRTCARRTSPLGDPGSGT